MMTKLRQLSGVFLWILVFSFLGLMVFEWGADYSGRSTRDNTVGSVNGEKLTFEQFNDMYQQAFQNERARTGKELDDTSLERLRNQVWEQFVQMTLFREEMDKLGIAVTDSEVVYYIYNSPLEDFRRHPAFQTEGVFDMNKYQAAFSDPSIPWGQIEDVYRQQIPIVKLQSTITSTVRVTDDEVLNEFKKSNLKAKVEYLSILPNKFQTDDITLSDKEIKNFYDLHKDEYKQNEMRDVSYVLFPVKPTEKDTVRIYSDFDRIRERLANGEKFSNLANEYSEDPSVKSNNGDLGYFDRNAMVKQFSDAAFDANIGDVVGPVKSPYGLHLIFVEDKKTENGIEKVKASHILLKITAGPSTIEEQENKARFFSEDAKDMGFDTAAKNSDYEVLKSGPFEERSGFIPGIGRNPSLMGFVFTSDVDAVSDSYFLEHSYVVVKLDVIKKAGYKDLESVKRLIENRIKFEKSTELAKEYASKLSDKVKSGMPFEQIADQDTDKKVTYSETALFDMKQSIPGIGKNIEFAATAFTLNIGETSDLVESPRGFFYERLLEKTEFDSAAFNSQKKQIKNQLLVEKRNKVFYDWYEDLKSKADIEDNRKLFNIF